MKKFLALTIFVHVSHPARAGIFDLMIYGPPDRYGKRSLNAPHRP
jgi:hypothetical protein